VRTASATPAANRSRTATARGSPAAAAANSAWAGNSSPDGHASASARPDATLSFYFSNADDEFKLGLSPTRCETVAIPMAARERLAS